MKSPTESSPRLLDRFLNLVERAPGSDRFILRLLIFLTIGFAIWFILSLNSNYLGITPTRGGSFSEGIIGTPRFINPALAITRADQDVTALVYRGLMKIGQSGALENDLAENVTVSEDGLTYNVILRRDITFHDGTPLTARDVVFTIRLIQDPDLKSPLRGNWTDIIVEEIGEYELNVVLEEAYAPFIENFTVGIMPAHAWSSLPIEQLPFSQLNTEPIGSGPFHITAADRDTSGLITKYSLEAYRQDGPDPKIDTIKLLFYQNEEQLLTAFQEGEIDATAYIPEPDMSTVMSDQYNLIEVPLPRTFGVFFNQNRSAALRDNAVREALSLAIDRDVLIDNSLSGFGVPIVGPTVFSKSELESENDIEVSATNTPATPAEQAVAALEAADWVKNDLGLWEKEIDEEEVVLSVTLRTSNAPLFESLLNSIAEQWREIGVEVVTEQFEQSDLVQTVIRPRNFEALLFGLDMSRSYDLYPFWHSSQQDDPGLNIAQYTNVEVDELLETARGEQFGPDRTEALEAAGTIIASEYPAIFLFQPTLTYVTTNEMSVTELNQIGRPADRFNNINEWYTESDSLWPIFRSEI